MHSAAACATCNAMRRSEPQWFGGVPVVRKASAMFTQSTAIHRNAPRSDCLSVHIRHPGKTAEWIVTPLGIVVGWGFVLAY